MSTGLVTAPANGNSKAEKLVVRDTGPAAYLFDTARFEHCYRIATAMAKASLIPEHLTHTGPKNNKKELPMEMIVGNCFMIVNQAIRWGMDPFALPAETYVVGNKLGFQGKLVAAVVNARADLHSPLQCIYNSGKGPDLAAVVFGSRKDISSEAWPLLKKYAKDEDGDAYTDLMSLGVMCVRMTVAQGKTDNQMWTKDPQQKLFYSTATKWARRHTPEIILGVLTDDDLERVQFAAEHHVDPTPRTLEQLADRLTSEPATDTTGFRSTGETDDSHVVDGQGEESSESLTTIDPEMLAKFDGLTTAEAIEAAFQHHMIHVSDLNGLVAARDAVLAKLPKVETEPKGKSSKKSQGSLV